MSRSSVSRHRRRSARTGQLRAAGIERVQHEHGRRRARRREREFLLTPLDPQLVVDRLADRAGSRGAKHVLGPRLADSPLCQVEIADAEVVARRAVALQFGAQHLRRAQHVLQPGGDVERVVRLANRIGEVPDGSAATIVFVSNASTPSAESDREVCCFQSGPLRLNP